MENYRRVYCKWENGFNGFNELYEIKLEGDQAVLFIQEEHGLEVTTIKANLPQEAFTPFNLLLRSNEHEFFPDAPPIPGNFAANTTSWEMIVETVEGVEIRCEYSQREAKGDHIDSKICALFECLKATLKCSEKDKSIEVEDDFFGLLDW